MGIITKDEANQYRIMNAEKEDRDVADALVVSRNFISEDIKKAIGLKSVISAYPGMLLRNVRRQFVVEQIRAEVEQAGWEVEADNGCLYIWLDPKPQGWKNWNVRRKLRDRT